MLSSVSSKVDPNASVLDHDTSPPKHLNHKPEQPAISTEVMTTLDRQGPVLQS